MKNLKKPVSLLLAFTIIMSLAGCKDKSDGEKKVSNGSVTKTGLDNGFTGEKKIDKNDVHYGWNLGQFYVCGYTQRTTDSDNADVFLKNVGDKVELHFNLLQDIDALNGDKNLSLNDDRNPYDEYFATQKFNDCRGLLIIRKTDYQNHTEDPVIYTDYLDGYHR